MATGQHAHDEPLGPVAFHLHLRRASRMAVAGLLRDLARNGGVANARSEVNPKFETRKPKSANGTISSFRPLGFRIFASVSDFVFRISDSTRSVSVAHLIQVGAGSGGMPVLDMLCRDPRVTRVTLIEPDIYKPHNIERHMFPASAIEEAKAEL